MKRFFTGFVLFLVFFLGWVTRVEAAGFFDNFDDGDTDGWVSFPLGTGYPFGNWRVEGGVLIEDAGRDHYKFLVEGLTLSEQIVETKILFHDNGYAGITVWHKDTDNWVDVLIFPGHNPNSLRVIEHVNGVALVYILYPLTTAQNTWYTMKIDTNSLTGELKIYLDNTLVKTHTVTTTNRLGSSGLNSGNAGGSFDNFSISYDEVGGGVASSSSVSQPTVSVPGCQESAPSNAPDLFQIDSFFNSAILYFAPSTNTDQYFISYSTNPSGEEHGILASLGHDGVQKYSINHLLSGLTYYFKVRGQNGCATGFWSQIMKVSAPGNTGETISHYYYY